MKTFGEFRELLIEANTLVDIRTMDMNSEQGSKLHNIHLKKAKADLKKSGIQFGGSASSWGIRVNKDDTKNAIKILERNQLQAKVSK